jgi:serine/threonine protein kinase/ankyrin repeat protein
MMQPEMLAALGGEDNEGDKDWAKVLELIVARPDAAKEKSECHGAIPLFYAVQRKAPPDVFSSIFKAYPGAAMEKDNRGRIPLHVIKTNHSIGATLLRAYPDSVKEKCADGYTPFHYIHNNYDLSLSLLRLDMLQTYPGDMSEKNQIMNYDYMENSPRDLDKRLALPLNYAIHSNLVELAHEILELRPETAKQINSKGDLPLHYAICNNVPEIALAILEVYPRAAQVRSVRGELPLFLALIRKLPVLAISLLDANVEAAKEISDGSSMLSIAVEFGLTEVAIALLHIYPDIAGKKDPDGDLPLHLVNGRRVTIALLEVHPDGAKAMNVDGNLPLHRALEKNLLDAAYLLVEAYPEAANIADRKGKFPLQHIAKMKDQNQEEHLKSCQLVYDATSPKVRDSRDLDRRGICLASPIEYIRKWAKKLGTRYQRYKVDLIHPVHQSATSVVWFATDVVNNAPVALKLMKNYDEFAREILTRFGDKPVDTCVTKVVGWHLPEGALTPLEHPKQREDVTEPDFYPEKPYVLVMERGSTSLFHELQTQRLAGYNPDQIKNIFTDTVKKVQALHNLGLIHSDLKPRNFLRMNGTLMLCDMDAALEIGKERTQDMKCSTAYCPPELAQCIFADGPTIKNIDAAFDVWSLGVILYELCTGQHLFSQDISNDNLVDDNDQTILCAWHTIPDSYLKRVFPGQDGQDAKDLIRWCLKGKPSERPNIENILAHPFCNPSAPTVSLRPMKDHAFLSHAQGDASGTAATLYSLHKALGVHLWYDMRATQLNLDGMKQGVRDSDVIVIVLTRTTLSRWFCRQEILEAVASNRRIQLILEEDSRFNPFDLELWRKAKMVYDCENKAFHETTPEWSVIEKAIDDHLDDAVPFRRRAYEQDGMMRAICQRCEWKIPPNPACVDTSKEFTIFAIFNTSTIFQQLRDGISSRLPGVRLTTDTAELSGAKYVLVMLTKGVIVEHEALLMQAIQEDKTNRVDRLVFLKKELIFDGVKQHDAWDFGSHEQKRVSDINMAVNAHEALPYRPKVAASSRYRHEYSLMVGELLEKLV